jgi:hypothetical protein
VNSQNNWYWSAENPMLINEVPLHDIVTGVWCAMSATKITGSFFVRPQIHTDVTHSLATFLSVLAQLRKAAITSVMSVRTSACISAAPTGEIFIKFDTRNFYESLSRKSKFVKNEQIYWALYLKT